MLKEFRTVRGQAIRAAEKNSVWHIELYSNGEWNTPSFYQIKEFSTHEECEKYIIENLDNLHS